MFVWVKYGIFDSNKANIFHRAGRVANGDPQTTSSRGLLGLSSNKDKCVFMTLVGEEAHSECGFVLNAFVEVGSLKEEYGDMDSNDDHIKCCFSEAPRTEIRCCRSGTEDDCTGDRDDHVSTEEQAVVDAQVKLAFDDQEKDNINNEHHVFQAMKMAGIRGVPTCLGTFYDAEEEHGPTCLVLSNEGKPLQIREEALALDWQQK
jgi:hypothetical protein